jgi:signal transduction histidine kinase
MEVKQLTKNIKNDFNRAISLVGIIPLLVFVYLVVGKLANVSALAGELGYIIIATIGVFIMGIVVGRRMLMSVTFKLIDDNQKILTMQQELIEKNRLAAITETVLTLGDQVNNPLLAISGNLELLQLELKNLELTEKTRNRMETMRNNFYKIREVTDKMSKLTKAQLVTIHGDTRMIDLGKSV